jgi:hypothetical protein
MRLSDLLLRSSPEGAVGDIQRDAGIRFWHLIAQAGVRRWSRGDPYVQTGKYVLVGLAPSYSVPDLELAEAVLERFQAGSLEAAVEFFDSSDARAAEEMDQFIPGIRNVFQTPIVGVWQNGVLVESASGFGGRQLVRRSLLGEVTP